MLGQLCGWNVKKKKTCFSDALGVAPTMVGKRSNCIHRLAKTENSTGFPQVLSKIKVAKGLAELEAISRWGWIPNYRGSNTGMEQKNIRLYQIISVCKVSPHPVHMHWFWFFRNVTKLKWATSSWDGSPNPIPSDPTSVGAPKIVAKWPYRFSSGGSQNTPLKRLVAQQQLWVTKHHWPMGVQRGFIGGS